MAVVNKVQKASQAMWDNVHVGCCMYMYILVCVHVLRLPLRSLHLSDLYKIFSLLVYMYTTKSTTYTHYLH